MGDKIQIKDKNYKIYFDINIIMKGMNQMSNPASVAAPSVLAKTPWQKFWIKFKKNWQLHLMIIFPLAYLILFSYVPLYGIQIAFKDYSPRLGIWDSPWVGLKHFKKFFDFYRWELQYTFPTYP